MFIYAHLLVLALAAPSQQTAAEAPSATGKQNAPRLLSQANRKHRAKERKEGGRIVGGVEAPEGEYPWQVSLYEAQKSPSAGHFCGGTLISPQWVVTAAHCFADGRRFRVYAGSQSLLGGGNSYDVAEVIAHEAYDPFTSENDIALVRLGEVTNSAGAAKQRRSSAPPTPATLIAAAEASKRVAPPEIAVVTGWGRTAEKGAGSPQLQMIEAPLVSHDDCNAEGKYEGQVTANMICAGGQGKDSCQGDSGGPLMVAKEDGSFVLAGVVSWGEGCAKEEYPGIYTNVAKYLDWIRQQTSSGGS